MKAKEEVKDASYDAFMGNVPRHRRRHRSSQTDFELSVTAPSDSNFDSEELDSSDGSNSGDCEGAKKDKEEKDLA